MYGKSPQIFAVAFRVAADFRKHTKTSPQIFLDVANTFLHALKLKQYMLAHVDFGAGPRGIWATIDLGHPSPMSV